VRHPLLVLTAALNTNQRNFVWRQADAAFPLTKQKNRKPKKKKKKKNGANRNAPNMSASMKALTPRQLTRLESKQEKKQPPTY